MLRSSFLFTSFALLVPAATLAQPAAPTAQHTEAVAEIPAEPPTDETVFNASLGTTIALGNTRSISGAASLRLGLRRDAHAVAAEAQATLTMAALRDSMTREFGDFDRTAENFTGKLRYDFFLTDDDAIFGSVAARRDTFAGLDSRVQIQLGYLRNLFREENHRLWAEAGYDLSLDNYFPNPLIDPMDMMTELPNSEAFHSARLFLGYDNHIDEDFTYLTGVECLIDVETPANTRLAWANELRSNLGGSFALGINFNLGFDNEPVQGTDSLDTTTIVTLTYTWKDEEEDEAAAPAASAASTTGTASSTVDAPRRS